MSPTQRLRAVLALLFLLVTAWILQAHASGDGGLTMPLGSVDELTAWADDATPAVMAAAVLRLAALGASAYGAAAMALVLLADLVRCRGAAGVVLAATPRFLRRLVGGHVIHISLAAGAVLGPSIRLAPAGAAPAATIEEVEPAPPAVATMVRLPPGEPVPPPQSPPAPPAPPAVWLVEPGDSFWSIAEANAEPDDVDRYWQDLITTNRDGLVAPDCPDLLIPGQTLLLPPHLLG